MAEVTPGFRVIGAYTYPDAEITRPNGIPGHMASLYGDYGFREGPLPGPGLGAGVRCIGNTPVGNANLALVPSVTLFDASLRFDLERLSASLHGMRAAVTASNLGDERNVASCDTRSACFYGMGRLVLGSLGYAW